MRTSRSVVTSLRRIAFVLALAFSVLASPAGLRAAGAQDQQLPAAVASGISPSAMAQIDALMREKASRKGVELKIDSQILHELKVVSGRAIAEGLPQLRRTVKYLPDSRIALDVQANVSASLLNTLRQLGAEVVDANAARRSVRILAALDRIELIASLPDVTFVQPKQEAITSGRLDTPGALPSGTGQGSVTSEGDATHRAAVARSLYGVNGTGVKIGVLSDGVTHLATSQSTGDLGAVTVLPGQTGSGDEGTAMLEIIHDLAPGAQLYFATAFTSIASFAQNIRDLRAAGCDIIVDDVYYYGETPFQDGQATSVRSTYNAGAIAQAVKDVTAAGALYLSAAGNSGNADAGTSGTWEGDFVDGGASSLETGARVHSFGSQTYDVVTSSENYVELFWADPLGAAADDYDLYVLNSTGTSVIEASNNIQNGTQDPYEIVDPPPVGSRIVILKHSGSARFLHLGMNRGTLSIATSGETHGHNATTAAGSFGVAATPAAYTPFGGPAGPYPNAFNSSNKVETFSSDGPRRIFFASDGTALTPGNFTSSGGQVLNKPDITAADGVSVTGAGGFENPFYGTSAAAPHAAAIVALIKSKSPWLTATQIRTVLTSTAIDIQAAGVDRDSGAGIAMADAALGSLGPSPTVTISASTVNVGGAIGFSVANGPAGPTDWVGLYPSVAGDGGFVDWWYLNGTKTVPTTGLSSATLQFTAPSTTGTYNVRLFSNGIKAATSGLVTVQQPALTINDVSMAEGNSGTTTATFTVTLNPVNAGQTVTVHYATADGTATAGSDYVATNGTLTFSPSVATQTIAVTINGDTTVEPDETFFVNLSNATNAIIGDSQGVGTILNDDVPPPPTVTINTPTVNPGGTIGFSVANGPANAKDWVALFASTAADTTYVDWMYLNGTKTPPATGLSNATLQFTAPTPTGTYNVRLFANNGFTKLATSGTVTVAPTPTLTINDVSVTEGNSGTTTATFTVTLNPVNTTQAVTVNYATADGTATAGSDYVAKNGTLTFNPSAATQTIAVTVNGDTTVEPDETFFVNLSNATNAIIGDSQGVGTILNDDVPPAPPAPTVTINTPTVNPGGTIGFSVANGPANAKDWVALFASAAADTTYVDWMYLNGTKTVPGAGLSSATLQFTAPTATGTYNVRLFANNGFTKLATSGAATVAPMPTLTINDVSVTEGNSGTSTATFTVTLNPVNTGQTVTVNYATADGTATAGSDYVATSGTLTFNPSVPTLTIAVTVNGDTTVEPDETFFVNLSGAANAVIGDSQGVGTILNDDVPPAPPAPTVTINTPTVNPGGTIGFSVANGPANAKDWVALFASAAADTTYVDWMYLNGTKTPPATGFSNATLQFTAPTPTGTYNIRLFANNGFAKLATSGAATVAPTPTLTINDVSVTEGNSGTTTATFTVTLNPVNTGQTVTVHYATADGTATAGSDYVATTGTLTFGPSIATQTIAVTINGDTTVDPDETFFVNLSNATNATIGDSQGVGTILNDDAPPGPTVTINTPTVNPGGTIGFGVANGPANAKDWVALFSSVATDTTYIDWMYLNGTKTPPGAGVSSATLQFTAPTPLGTYNIRLFSNNTFTKVATSGAVTVAPVPTLTINDVSVMEGNSGTKNATFTVTLNPVNTTQTVTVNYASADGTATAGSDYVMTSGTLTFGPSVSTQTIAVTINGDTTMEADETFFVNLSGAVNAVIGDSQGVGTILNDDAPLAPTVTINTPTVSPDGAIGFSVANGPANAKDWVALFASTAADTTYVDWMYLNGTKTAPSAGVSSATLQFIAPTTTGTYNVRLFANNGFTKLATSATATVTPVPTLTINDVSVTEGNSGTSTANFTVTLNPVNTTQTVAVNYATADGTATAGSDYVATSGMLTFGPSTPTQTIAVTINGDTTVEPNETFFVNLFGAANAVIGDSQGTGTILNDDMVPAPTVTANTELVAAGGAIGFEVDNGPANPMDWAGLYLTTAADAAFVDWMYLNGTRTAPTTGVSSGTLQFTAPAGSGNYNIRLFANNGFTKLATTGGVFVQPGTNIDFSGLIGAGSPFGTYSESGYTVSSTSGSWTVNTYGNPTPSIQFVATATGDIKVTADGGASFHFSSVDLYSSTTTIPYTITGLLNSTTVFTQTATEPLTHGNFVTVQSSFPSAVVDTLVIHLANDRGPCCGNPVGIDNIALSPAGLLTPSVTIDTPAVVAGGTIDFRVANGPADVMDGVWLYYIPVSILDSEYLNGLNTPPATGVSNATLHFTAPTYPGTYHIAFEHDGAVIARSGPILVTP